jgi:hypothetical protein
MRGGGNGGRTRKS